MQQMTVSDDVIVQLVVVVVVVVVVVMAVEVAEAVPMTAVVG